MNLERGKHPVKLPVHLLLPSNHLGLVVVQRVPALLLEADGHHEVDDGGELVEVEVEPVGLGGQLPVEAGRLLPVERSHMNKLDSNRTC